MATVPYAEGRVHEDTKDAQEMLEDKEILQEEAGALDLVSEYANMPRGEAARKFWRLLLCGILVTSAGVYAGYTSAIPGAIVGNRGFVEQFGTIISATGVKTLDANYVGLWGAISYVTQAMAQFTSPFTANRFGLRFNMWFFTIMKLVTIITEIFATTWWHFLLAKMFNGWAAGLIGTSVLSYASEIAMPQLRGTIVGAYAFFFAFGQLASAIALQIINTTTPFAFRSAFYSQFVFLGMWLPILILLPESPIWLHKRGNIEKAKRSRARLTGHVAGYDAEHEYAVFAQDIDRSVQISAQSSKYSMLACFKGTNFRRTLISTSVLCSQNFVGVPLMLNAVYFFSLIGLTNAFVANLIISCVLLAGVMASFYLVDKVGRRPLLLGGVSVMTLCVCAVGGIGFGTINSTAGSAMIALMAIWAAAYAVSIAPIGWIALVEISTPSLRVQTVGIAALIQSCVNVVFNYTVPLMLSPQYAGWGAKIGLFFGGLALLTVISVYFLFPETKNRGYPELDEMFLARLPARKFSTYKTAVSTANDVLQASRAKE